MERDKTVKTIKITDGKTTREFSSSVIPFGNGEGQKITKCQFKCTDNGEGKIVKHSRAVAKEFFKRIHA